jgi:hypothetical protein
VQERPAVAAVVVTSSAAVAAAAVRSFVAAAAETRCQKLLKVLQQLLELLVLLHYC